MSEPLKDIPFDDPTPAAPDDFQVSMVRQATETETSDALFGGVIAGIIEGRWRKQVDLVRQAYGEAEKKARSAGLPSFEVQKTAKDASDPMKKRLPAVLFSGTFARRATDALKKHSGLICVDLDHLDERLPSIREAIEADPHTKAAFVSPSGTGLKVIFRCSSTEPHLKSYRAAERYCLQQFGLEIDPACKDVSRLCFVSYDPETFIAQECVPLPDNFDPPAEFKAPQEAKPGVKLLASGAEPWDDYDRRADVAALLQSHGWTPVGRHGWRRPGKADGVSATWDKVPGRFYVFTSSTEFQPNHTYRPWHVYAILNHGGNWSQAVAALRKEGFGEALTRPKPTPSSNQSGNGNPGVYDPGYEEPPDSQNSVAVDGGGRGPTPNKRVLPRPVRADELCANPPPKPDVLIEGILYAVGTMLFAGPSKSMKTFSALDVGIAIASGEPWLNFKTTQAPVLYLNLELQDFATEERISKICAARGGKPPRDFVVWNLRGETITLAVLTAELPAMIKEFGAKVVCVDPHYKVSAVSDMEENSNDNQGKLLTLMEGICSQNGAALILTHHFAKGDASAKNAIDRASGGGVFARWGDVMLTFTPHEEDNAMSVEMALRNFAPVAPFVVRWVYPRWVRDKQLDPADLKSSRGAKERHTPDQALRALGDQMMTYSEWCEATGMSESTFRRKREELLKSGKVIVQSGIYRVAS